MTIELEESTAITAAQRLLTAQRTGVTCGPIRDLLSDPADIDSAYRVQRAVIADRIAAGARVVGAKIGLTARVVQEQFGVFQPDFGVLLDDMVYGHGEPIPRERLLQPRAEGEIAFVLGRDLDRPNASVADVLRATDFVQPAIEVVDSRITGWDLSITDTVADNASSGVVVLGAAAYSLRDRDLSRIGMVLERDGEPVSFGAGHACLGSPVTAVAWLARELVRREQPLRAGAVVMSGALGPMVPIAGAGRFRLRLDGLGSVEAVIEQKEDL
ncbi:2-keto-4-pentenoate hydratase [Nocardia sp. NPDC056000]|uniref:2-keto-4-pentenoate hydratase n=1 Tax=Nocardia sp. NPDC056000 TaxID=3345674 RepID=UPI0035DFA0FE